MASVVTTGFVRLTTTVDALAPVTVDAALSALEVWFSSPVVRWVAPTDRHLLVLRGLLSGVQRGGRLVNDAHLAALAIEHGGTVYSQDTDFAAFRDVRWVNPLA
jgi:toxin-antitoxin system PIN domain toxin